MLREAPRECTPMTDEHKTQEIKRLLAKYNITQRQIAHRAQVSPPGVCKAISGLSKYQRLMKIIWEMLKERSADESEIAFLLTKDKIIDDNLPPLKKLLQEAGIKQHYIAQKANVSEAAVSLVVRGKSTSRHIEQIVRQEAAKAGVKLDTEDRAGNDDQHPAKA